MSDFGLDDNYVGIMKAVILKINPEVDLVDLTHSVEPQNLIQAALHLHSAYKFFPESTIFLCVVDPGVGSNRNAIIVKNAQHIFIGPDNGIFSPTLKETGVEEIYTITNDHYFLSPVSHTFHGRDIFAPVAAHVAKGVALKEFGKKRDDYMSLEIPRAELKDEEKKLYGEIIAIDRFGNLITNVEDDFVVDQSEHIHVHIKDQMIPGLSLSYADRSEGALLALVGSKGYLEISVNHGSAKRDLKAEVGDPVVVEYIM